MDIYNIQFVVDNQFISNYKIHLRTCLTKEITRCPYCNAAPFSLIPEILYPERALSMPNDIDKLN